RGPARGLTAYAQNSLQFSARNHVEAGPLASHQPQNRQHRIGFDRITERVRNGMKSATEGVHTRADHRRGINVQRSSVAFGKACQRNALAVKFVAEEIRGARSRSRAAIAKGGWA